MKCDDGRRGVQSQDTSDFFFLKSASSSFALRAALLESSTVSSSWLMRSCDEHNVL
jgi:hypothetical protein